MKPFCSKLLVILSSLSVVSAPALANIYRYDIFNNASFVAGSNDPAGTLTGFIVIDMDLVDASFSNAVDGPTTRPIPSWLTEASLTFNAGAGSSHTTVTRTLTSAVPFSGLDWTLSPAAAAAGGFNPEKDITTQLSTFGLTNDFEFKGAVVGTLKQQFYQAEFAMESPVLPDSPGPLPILGLAPLAWYFRKFKNKLKKS